MFWALVLGGAAVAAIFAMLRGQNPLFWALSSLPGVALLTVIPPAKGKLGERNRARREVGNKLGIFTSSVVVLVMIILAIVGVV